MATPNASIPLISPAGTARTHAQATKPNTQPHPSLPVPPRILTHFNTYIESRKPTIPAVALPFFLTSLWSATTSIRTVRRYACRRGQPTTIAALTCLSSPLTAHILANANTAIPAVQPSADVGEAGTASIRTVAEGFSQPPLPSATLSDFTLRT